MELSCGVMVAHQFLALLVWVRILAGQLKNIIIMAQISGATFEKSFRGFPSFIRIDLRKHADIIPLLVERGLLKEEIKWSAKMKKSLQDPDFKDLDLDNIWDE